MISIAIHRKSIPFHRLSIVASIAASIGLAACTTTPKTRVVTVEVKVPVPVKCAPDIPAPTPYATEGLDLDGSIFSLVQALLVEREERKEREAVLNAAVEACR